MKSYSMGVTVKNELNEDYDDEPQREPDYFHVNDVPGFDEYPKRRNNFEDRKRQKEKELNKRAKKARRQRK